MQVLLTYFSLAVTFLLFIFMVTRSLNKSRTYFAYSKLPPAPWKLPLIGHMHHLRGLPHHALRDLAKKHGPLFFLRLGEINAAIVSSPRVAMEVMKTQDLSFADRPALLAARIFSYNYANISFAPYSDYWMQLRKICVMELLSTKKVQSLWSIREEEVSNLIHNISSTANSRSPTNLSESLASLTNDIIARAAFGKKCKDKDVFMVLVQEALTLAGGFDFADLFPSLSYLHWISGTKSKLEKIQRKIDKILEDIIIEHRENRGRIRTNMLEQEEDVVDVFLRLQEENNLEIPMENNNIKAVIMDIYAAGSEASSTTIVWAMTELMRNPKAMAKVQDEVRLVFKGKAKISQSDVNELSYLRSVVKETLRLHPPAALLLPRENRENCVVLGYDIPKGTKVIVNGWAIGRDPDFWPNAKSFQPERFADLSIDFNGTNFSYIPFGSGRRICPGMSFGVATMELTLAQLLYHFDWKMADDANPDELDMSEIFGLTVCRKFPLNLVPTIYIP